MLDRRAFLAGLGAATLAGRARAEIAFESQVVAAPASVQLAPAAYDPTQVWAYDGAVPGAGLRVPQGARIRRRLVNDLPQPTTIHWHGIRIDNAMDGVGHLTQAPVPPGESFDYDFTVPDAGTYWYHPHQNTLEQLSRGLSAPLIVEEAEAPDVDDDIVLMINDWRLGGDAQILADFANMHDRSHAGRIGNYLTVNGSADFSVSTRRNARLRLRLINAASGRILQIGAQGLTAWVAALDGMPLDAPEPLSELALAPAQRADLIVDVTAGEGEEAFLTSRERDGTYALASLTVGPGTRTARPEPVALPPNAVADLALAGARTATLRMEGGAMGSMAEAKTPDGQTRGIRDLVGMGNAWALNGISGMPETPLLTAARGETVRIALGNDTAWPHAMHLHGHHFREITPAGPGPLRDTLLVMPRSATEIAFVADNPGDWMFHCHMLAHQAAGMSSWLRVV